jgi:Asp-tRNA(Asn)/Glu-tRNA(Gln) amidotransferase A subunit family amidase
VGADVDALDATALARAIREGRVSPVDAVERALDAIAAYDAELNACTVTFADEARRAPGRRSAAAASRTRPRCWACP